MAAARVDLICAPRNPLSRAWETENLDEHVALIKRQSDASLEDDETVRLAQKIVAAKPDGTNRRGPFIRAWGNEYILPICPEPPSCTEAQHDQLESIRIWNFIVSNWTYLEDPPSFDLFSTVRFGLDAKASADLLERDLEKERSPTKLVALDPTVKNAVPGWEYPRSQKIRDFVL
jgi:hypothetical protein